jgi:TRAP-type C4-dicarboxylate transport system permease small subunit
MKGLKKFDNIFDRMVDVMFFVASGLSLVIFFSTCIELFMRYFFNRPQIWAVEVTEYTMLYITFLGAAWLLREEGHVKIDLLLSFLAPRSQAFLNSITSLLGAVVCSVIAFYGSWSTWLHYQKGLTTFSAMELLKWPFLIVIPFGSLLLLIQFVRSVFSYWKKFKSYKTAK